MNGNAEREREREAGTRTVLLPARSGLGNGIGPMLSDKGQTRQTEGDSAFPREQEDVMKIFFGSEGVDA